tara:strand:+ start:54 stop:314 length:261 start_codon:yes stop_codon:yes gene_type:complete
MEVVAIQTLVVMVLTPVLKPLDLQFLLQVAAEEVVMILEQDILQGDQVDLVAEIVIVVKLQVMETMVEMIQDVVLFLKEIMQEIPQ